MHQFLTILVRWGMMFAAVIAGLLLLLGAVLIWWPELIVKILRFGLAAVCVSGGGYLLFCLLYAFFRK